MVREYLLDDLSQSILYVFGEPKKICDAIKECIPLFDVKEADEHKFVPELIEVSIKNMVELGWIIKY